jgi:hypothetical protein
MKNYIKQIHQLLDDGNLVAAQDVFRNAITRLPESEVLSQSYILKAYELVALSTRPFEGLTAKQIAAHSLIIRQLLIENSEEFDRRVSRL